ncbi:type VI secretion system tip protein VgrG [Enterobacter asburiae]|nr:type VI secretion system tip protein VgrG [Enterobacter asburiae]
MDPISPYTLTINDSPVLPDVLRFRGTEALSKPFSWRIEFTTPQEVVDADVLLKDASLIMRRGKTIHGVITGFEWLGTSVEQSHYAVTLSSRLALMNLTRRCSVWQNLSVPELVEIILRAHGLEGSDFEFRLQNSYPTRELITQWRESDLEFIHRLLAETGIWYRCDVNDATGRNTVIFADSQLGYQFGITQPYREPAGLYDGAEESVWGLRTRHNTVTGQVQTRDYNYYRAAEPMDSMVAVRNDASTVGEHYRYGGPFFEAGDATDPDVGSGAFLARLHHEREMNKSTQLHLFSNAFCLTPGQVLETPDSTLNALRDGVLITFTSFRASRDSRLHVSVWGMPYSEQFCFRPTEISRPQIRGTLPARIESRTKNDTYAHIDSTGRYRVKLDFSREDAEPGFNYLWVRQAKPYAGEELGWHMPLIDGTEVGIAFDGGDIDRPYIAHAFHDSEHADIVTRDNRSQNILRTAAGNELRMEDKRGEEYVALTSPYGATQLNQGHITDEQEKARGSGFELRTDEYGVIRVEKGLFITADGQTKAAGDVLDMETALKEIDVCRNQLQQLAAAAGQVQALEADIASQIAMFNLRLKPLNEMIHFHGPEGAAFTSGEHIQLTAAGNVAINAGEDLSSGSIGNTAILAGDEIGLFARTGELSINASEGPVQIQAQNGAMHLSAEQRLHLISASDMLFAGKKKVTLIGGGSYLTIEAGKIEYGTDTTYTRKIKRTHLTVSATQPVSFPLMGTSHIYSAVYQLRDEQGNILAGTPYSLKTPSGQVAAGYSNDEGWTVPVYTPEQEDVDLHLVQRKPDITETLWFIGDEDKQQLATELREKTL